MRSLRLPLLLGFVGLVVAACSGANPTDLFGSSGSGGASSGTTSTSASSSSTSSSSTSSGGTDASTSSSTSSGGKDAAVDAPAPLGDKDHVFCGSANGDDVYCQTGSICCARGKTQGGQLKYDTYECLPNKNQCSGNLDAVLECDDKDDCNPGEFCCAQTFPAGGNSTRYVRTQCQQNNCNGYSARMCQVGKTDECLNGAECKQSQVLKDFGVCAQQ